MDKHFDLLIACNVLNTIMLKCIISYCDKLFHAANETKKLYMDKFRIGEKKNAEW